MPVFYHKQKRISNFQCPILGGEQTFLEKDKEYNCYYEKCGSEVKNITEELPFEIPDSWCWVRFPSIVYFSLGKTPDRHTDKYWNNGTYPWFSIADMQDKKTITTSKEKISETALKEKFNGSLSPKGTLLMSFKLTVGRTSILGVEAVHNEAIISIFPFIDQKHITRDYLMNTLGLLVEFVEQTDAIKGATLNSNKLQHMFVPIPPIAEQERIVAEIEKIEPLIAEYDKLEQQATKLDSEIYDKLKKSILQYAIQGKLVPQDKNDEPASELLKRIRAEKKIQLGKKYVESYIFKGDDNCYYEKIGKNEPVLLENLPFDIPDSWCWARLDDIAIFENGDRSNKYPVETDYVSTGIPFWGAKDMLNNKLTKTNNLRYISQTKFEELGNGKLRDKDFVCLLRGAVGKWASFEVDEDVSTGFINAQMVIIRSISMNLVEWLKIYLSSSLFTESCSSFTSGTAVAQMSAKDLSNFSIPIPPYNEQLRICEQVKNIFNTIKGEN